MNSNKWILFAFLSLLALSAYTVNAAAAAVDNATAPAADSTKQMPGDVDMSEMENLLKMFEEYSKNQKMNDDNAEKSKDDIKEDDSAEDPSFKRHDSAL